MMKKIIGFILILVLIIGGYFWITGNQTTIFASPRQIAEKAFYGYEDIKFKYELATVEDMPSYLDEDFNKALHKSVFDSNELNTMKPSVFIIDHKSKTSKEDMQHVQVVYKDKNLVFAAYELEPSWSVDASILGDTESADSFGNEIIRHTYNDLDVTQIKRTTEAGLLQYYYLESTEGLFNRKLGYGILQGHEVFVEKDNIWYSLMYEDDDHDLALELLLEFSGIE